MRLQVDPIDPPPARDARWVFLVLGVGLAIIGVFLLIADAIVSASSSAADASCGSAANGDGCGTLVFDYVLLLPGVVLLLVGGVLASWAFLRVLRGPVAE